MKTQPTRFKCHVLRCVLSTVCLTGLLPVLLLLLSTQTSQAGSATWNLNAANSYWDIASNWTPQTVPNGPNDVATFDVSTTSLVYPEAFHTLELNSIVFNPG